MSLEIADVVLPGNAGAFNVGRRAEVNSLTDLAGVHRALLKGPVTATLATVNPNGVPQLTPVWCNHDGTYVNLNSVKGRLKDRNLDREPRLSLMLVNPANPYHWMTIIGHVVRVIDEDDPVNGQLATDNINVLAESYLNARPYPLRSPGERRRLYKVEPTRIVTFGPAG